MKLVLAALAGASIALPALAQDEPAGHDMAEMDHSAHDMSAMGHSMAAGLGPYDMTREASGTAWQPDVSEHGGVMVHRGEWMLMGHMTLNGVYDRQDGPRGDEKSFVAGMVMGSAQRSAGPNTVRFRAMLSPDPLMGKRGYPLLLASGETADGVTHLVDRQHPHDLFMELSASYSRTLSEDSSAFVYAGLPGEPAFGPPAFMHRLSIMDSPEAPISHHWLDSTHITFGMVTAGLVHKNWKVEASRFRGREPDQDRFDIETGRLDSTAVRLSWNPGANWSLQASWADVTSPEALDPTEDQIKWSASVIHTRRLENGGWWSTTAAWGRRVDHHGELDAYVLESAIKPNDAWTIFARAEQTENAELSGVPLAPPYRVSKASVGAVRDFAISGNALLGVGALYGRAFVPTGLEAPYGGDRDGAMAFLRLKIG